MRKRLAAGNWKMNGLQVALSEVEALHHAIPTPDCDVVICPPTTLISSMGRACLETAISVGGQDCHVANSGAHTGDISAEMLKDAGADYVILGHSERRSDHSENSELIRSKTKAAWAAGLCAIICVGETLLQREAANTLDIVGGQMAASIPDAATAANTVVAYEPIWAIGTGKTPTLNEIGAVHDFIRARLERRFGDGIGRGIRILYGGSVSPINATEIFHVSNVDGALVGGASLKAADFSVIVKALSQI